MQYVCSKEDLIAELKKVAEFYRSSASAIRMIKRAGYTAAAKHHDSVAYGLEYAISMLESWVEPAPK